MHIAIRILLMAAGTLAVALGVIGIFLPILPTTPFLLLTAFWYARSSERFLNWLLTNRWFGAYIRDYRQGRGIPLREKIISLAALWLTIGSSAVFFVPMWWGRLLLALIAIGATIHLARMKVSIPEDPSGHAPSVAPAAHLPAESD
jgi:uncharacterized membrane protein YbaN (DUF454 family)